MQVFNYFCRILTKNCYVSKILKKLPNVKFNENWFNCSPAVTYGQTDAQTDMGNTIGALSQLYTLKRQKTCLVYVIYIFYFIINHSDSCGLKLLSGELHR